MIPDWMKMMSTEMMTADLKARKALYQPIVLMKAPGMNWRSGRKKS